MTSVAITEILKETMKIALLLSGPMLITGLIAGLVVSIFQAATQIQEMTLTFIPKIFGVAIALVIFLPWMIRLMTDYAIRIFLIIPTIVR
ncbi:MAG: flagellar biosynthesis protein FliQ [bacterium]